MINTTFSRYLVYEYMSCDRDGNTRDCFSSQDIILYKVKNPTIRVNQYFEWSVNYRTWKLEMLFK